MESFSSPLLKLSILLLFPLLVVLCHPTAAAPYPKEAHPIKSGYLTVNSTTGSAIFYTYYEAQNPNKNFSQTPIIIWLQGGSAASSMLANFYELGPWILNQNLELDPNPSSWNRIFGLLFLDNPIGTGFSIAASVQEIPRNQHDVAKHLVIALKEFVALDESFKSRPIYIAGESYGGKYATSLAYYILKKNALVPIESRVNLFGISIGNGFIDPIVQIQSNAVVPYNFGLINEKQKTVVEKIQLQAVGFIKSGNWSEVSKARGRVLGTLKSMTGLATFYDFRRPIRYQDDLVAKFMSDLEVKRALGVNESLNFKLHSNMVGEALHDDVMKSIKYMMEYVVKNTRVLLYQGQCDLKEGVVSTLDWVKEMRWEGINKFLDAERKIWRVDRKLAGYVQKWENLSHVVVMNAGHLVPTDQAVNSQIMIENWILENVSDF